MTISAQVEACRRGAHPRLVAQVPSGWVVMAQSQVLSGYCILLADPVISSLNDLDAARRAAFLADMSVTGDAVLSACQPRPRRINYEMLGNLDPTLHAHIVPRYESEPEALRSKAIWSYPPELWDDPARAFDPVRHGALRDAIRTALAGAHRTPPESHAMSASLWRDAAAFAARAHEGATRKDAKTPYVSHVFRVAMTVRDCFGFDDPATLAAALLHDTIEDTGTDYDEIEERFGAEVAGLVAALSKDMRLPEPERERRYDEALAAADWRARLIKVADVLDNLSDVAPGDAKGLGAILPRAARALALARGGEQSPVLTAAAAQLAQAAQERRARG